MTADNEFPAPSPHPLRREAGDWLKRRRRAAGLTQRQLAVRLGLDYYTFISQIEGGRARVPSALYAAWAAALGVSAADFAKKMLECYDPDTYRALGLSPGDLIS